MPHSPGTSRSDDYGGGTSKIQPLTKQQQAWHDNYTRDDRNPKR